MRLWESLRLRFGRHLKTPEQVEKMRAAGRLVWQAHQVAAAAVRPGVSTAEIDAAVEKMLVENGAVPLFKGVRGKVPYPAATCISVNEQIVHGIPGPRRLCPGDIVGIDIGARLDGWCGDAAVTYAVEPISPEARRLLAVTESALALAVRLMGEKKRWSEVGREIQRYVAGHGFTVVEELTGHSIGRKMWEGLHAPNWSGPSYERCADFPLQPGLVVAVEPMVNAGTRYIRTLPDGWTITTADGSLSAHFEHTVAVTEHGAEILTAGPQGPTWGAKLRAEFPAW